VQFKWRIFWPYYQGLIVQTKFLYRESTLFKDRWQELGLDIANKLFEDNLDEQTFFFCEARKQPLKIRFRILMNAIQGKEAKPYYINK